MNATWERIDYSIGAPTDEPTDMDGLIGLYQQYFILLWSHQYFIFLWSPLIWMNSEIGNVEKNGLHVRLFMSGQLQKYHWHLCTLLSISPVKTMIFLEFLINSTASSSVLNCGNFFRFGGSDISWTKSCHKSNWSKPSGMTALLGSNSFNSSRGSAPDSR